MANTYSIKYGDTELYSSTPSHIYDWRVSGVNCATEDYSVGSVNDIILTYVTDIQPVKVSGEYQRVTVGGGSATPVYFRVREVTKTAGQNRYTVTCTSEYDELDQPLPDSYATPVANETAWQLFCRLQGVSAVNPPSVPNKDYVINPNWYSSGMTYRQAYQFLSQLMAFNVGAFLITGGSGDASNRFSPTLADRPGYYDTLYFTPNNVKEIEFADYEVPSLQGVWIESGNSDTSYYKEGSTDPSECLILPYNPMINSSDTSFLTPIFQQVIALQNYTPMKLTTWTDAHYYQGVALNIQVSNMVWWSYSNKWMKYTANNIDYYCPIFSWELSPSGLILEGTGNPIRQYDSGYTYEQAITAIEEKVNHLTFVDIYPNWKEESDLDNCRNIGFYTYTSSALHNPRNAGGTLYVFKYGSNYLYQVAFSNNSTNDDEVYVYIRKYNSSGFHAWRRISVEAI